MLVKFVKTQKTFIFAPANKILLLMMAGKFPVIVIGKLERRIHIRRGGREIGKQY